MNGVEHNYGTSTQSGVLDRKTALPPNCGRGRQPDGSNNYDCTAGPDIPRYSKACHASAGGELRLYTDAEPRFLETGRAGDCGREPQVKRLR